MLIEISGGSRISQTRWGHTNPRGWGQKPVIWQDFCQNCMKMKWKNFDRGGGGRVPLHGSLSGNCKMTADLRRVYTECQCWRWHLCFWISLEHIRFLTVVLTLTLGVNAATEINIFRDAVSTRPLSRGHMVSTRSHLSSGLCFADILFISAKK